MQLQHLLTNFFVQSFTTEIELQFAAGKKYCIAWPSQYASVSKGFIEWLSPAALHSLRQVNTPLLSGKPGSKSCP
jgi:hypothetical protein